MLWAFVALLAMGCSGGDGGADGRPEGTVIPIPEMAPAPASPITEVTVSNGLLPSLMSQASESQRAILEDGVITFAEYERATLETVACFEQNGLQVMTYPWMTRPPEPGLRLVGRGVYLYLGIAREGEDEAAGQLAADACEVAHSRTIQQTWFDLTRPTDAELQRLRDAVGECARALGADVPEHPTRMDLAILAYPPDTRPRGRAMDPVYVQCAIPVALANNIYVPNVGF